METTTPRSSYSPQARKQKHAKRGDYSTTGTRHIYQGGEAVVAHKTKRATRKAKAPKYQLALLIAAHNESIVIEQTLRSAIRAGMEPRHIYVVDDNSSDDTRAIAASILGIDNTIKVRRSGKGLALTKATKKFRLTKRYRWVHIADADGGFARGYFTIFRKALRVEYAAATGYVRSLPSGSVGQYRVLEYTIGMELHRRFQALTHTVSVIPGPTSCFRSDVLEQVNFDNKSLTEDFDVTMQLHRQKLGKVQFIPRAIAYTQDPRTTQDFTKQITRWNRGIMQGMTRHKVGLRPQRIDAYLSYQILQNMMLFLNYFVLLPYMAIAHRSVRVLALAFLTDVLLMFGLTLLVAFKTNRKDILSAFPHIYFYRWLTLGVFLRAFTEVVILKRFRVTEGSWSTAGRRYKSAVTV